MQIFDFINIPLGWVLKFVSNIFGGNFALAVFFFTLLINLALIPLTIKSQKSAVQQTRIKPKLDELKKQYGDDRQKQGEAMQKLYQEEGVSMSGGCLPMILRMVLLLSIYTLILSPLTYMTGVDKTKLNNVTTTISAGMAELKKEDKNLYSEYVKKINWSDRSSTNQLSVVSIIRENEEVLEEILSEKEYNKIKDDLAYIKEKDNENHINFSFITEKIDLTKTPKFSLDIFHDFQLIWLMPFGAFLAQLLTSWVSMRMQKKANPDAPNMSFMLYTMPLFTLFIGFSLPAGVAFYWLCSSLISGGLQAVVQELYGPHKMLARERLKELNAQCKTESEKSKKINESKTNGGILS